MEPHEAEHLPHDLVRRVGIEIQLESVRRSRAIHERHRQVQSQRMDQETTGNGK
jgi:hypothetical protein